MVHNAWGYLFGNKEFQTSRLDYKEEKRLKAFFNFMPLRGAAQERLGCEPLLTLGNQRETLWTPL
jgi:hypothetical protein